MVQHAPTPKTGVDHPEQIPGYTYGTTEAATSPLTLEDLDRLKAAVGLTADDEDAFRDAAAILAGQADDMVIAWPAQLRQQPWLGGYSATPTARRRIVTDHADSLHHIPMRYLFAFTTWWSPRRAAISPPPASPRRTSTACTPRSRTR